MEFYGKSPDIFVRDGEQHEDKGKGDGKTANISFRPLYS
jgi:hypothetical protein